MDTNALSQKLTNNGARATPSSFESDVKDWFKVNGRKMATLAGSPEEAKRILVAAVSSVNATPSLLGCDFNSFATCLLTSAQMKLYPGPMGECAYVPFNNKKTGKYEAKFMPMYQGLLKLAYNAGLTAVNSAVVYEADQFSYQEGDEPRIIHKPFTGNREERGKRIGVYAVLFMGAGRVHRQFCSAEQIDGIKGMSRGAKSYDSPWSSPNADVVDWMWRKTALKQALKSVPKSAELNEALRLDDEAEVPSPGFDLDMTKLMDDVKAVPIAETKQIEGEPVGDVVFTDEHLAVNV